jgi:hypothetical protein
MHWCSLHVATRCKRPSPAGAEADKTLSSASVPSVRQRLAWYARGAQHSTLHAVTHGLRWRASVPCGTRHGCEGWLAVSQPWPSTYATNVPQPRLASHAATFPAARCPPHVVCRRLDRTWPSTYATACRSRGSGISATAFQVWRSGSYLRSGAVLTTRRMLPARGMLQAAQGSSWTW